MKRNQSISFFDAQFQKQVAGKDFALNPFELATRDFVRGRTLDLGCGLGNLSIEAARRGASVVAVDASPAAIERIREVAARERLKIEPVLADLENYSIREQFDTVIAVGIVMFFRREKALVLLEEIKRSVAPGGRAIVNVLTEGTTYMGMFEPGNYTLFARDELRERFKGWEILFSRRDSFAAPESTTKEFCTLVAQKPGRGK
jgi:tellurite methyltransferase